MNVQMIEGPGVWALGWETKFLVRFPAIEAYVSLSWKHPLAGFA